ncbi:MULTISPECIES: hypothetical protein [unclassified Clostridium]|uniref:hypothetical protein n=1 Tax=unclassified Clostridium TaxID=2614128 RepID=UPI000EBCD185|nr:MULTISPECIES: hypothetical protein [unclassified Clostridium]HCQ89892.1 hypothetical protein [Clostridium sp.]
MKYNYHLTKEQLMRSRHIANVEKSLMNMYMNLMTSEKEGNLKRILYEFAKDEKEILNIMQNSSKNVI